VRKANILTATEGTKSNCQEGGKNYFQYLPQMLSMKEHEQGTEQLPL